MMMMMIAARLASPTPMIRTTGWGAVAVLGVVVDVQR
jgi:hypothetical protein